MPNPFCHIELHSNDLEKSKEFYTSLLDWKLKDVSVGDSKYTMIDVGEGTGGGMLTNPAPEGTPSKWQPYILVDDVHATAKKAEELGATILVPVQVIPEYGSFFMIQDTAGAVIAFWQNANKQ